jgi:hypothetical protein
MKSVCGKGLAVEEYCFDPKTAKNGDTVAATMNGFKQDHPWEVTRHLSNLILSLIIYSNII